MLVRTTSWVAVFVAVVLAGAGWARAAGAPKPVITGTAQVGETLVVSATLGSVDPASAAWQWLRCGADKAGSCTAIPGATADRYRIVDADVGFRLRVTLTVTGADGTASSERSAATGVVKAAPAPVPSPTPTPSPTPSPSPGPSPTPTPAGSPSTGSYGPSAPPAPVTAQARPRLLDPFPVVRIRGVLTRGGARVTLLTVHRPRDARTFVRCRHGNCPRRRLAVPARMTRLRPFERALRAGTRLEIKVVRPGWIGKWTVITIRRGAAPRRRDRCLYPGGLRPVRCPAA
jgi:hypothetical protein